MAWIRRNRRNGRNSDAPEVCPHCGAPLSTRKNERPKKWHERTSVTLCVAAALVVIGFGFIHIITGVQSPYGLPCDIVAKESFGYRETFVNARRILVLPYTAARRKYPLGLAALQRAGYVDSGRLFEARIMTDFREDMRQWQAEFEAALGRPASRWQDQLQAAERGPAGDSEDARACNLRGVAFARQGEYAAAIAEFGRAVRKEPAFADAFYNRALVSIAIGTLGQAADDFSHVLEIRPGFLEGYLRRGGLYAAMNEHDKAVADFTKAIQIDTRCAEAWFHRSLAHYAKGAFDEARADVQKLQALGLPVPPGYVNALRSASGG